MAVPYIMPLGFIDQPTETGATFILTNPEDSLGLRPGTPVTVWRYSPELLAVAKLRGAVSDVGYTTATFTTIETQTDPRWTHDLPIIRPARPGLPGPGRLLRARPGTQADPGAGPNPCAR